MMDCKKYLDKSNNDLDAAVKLMRSEGGVKADKKSSRIAAGHPEGFFEAFANIYTEFADSIINYKQSKKK